LVSGVLPKIEGSGIIYTLTVHDAERVAGWLKSRGINVEAYTGETGEQRESLENALLQNQIKSFGGRHPRWNGF